MLLKTHEKCEKCSREHIVILLGEEEFIDDSDCWRLQVSRLLCFFRLIENGDIYIKVDNIKSALREVELLCEKIEELQGRLN